MLNTLFASVITTTVNWQAILLCTLSSLILGIAATGIYCYKNMYTKSFVVTLALLPAMVKLSSCWSMEILVLVSPLWAHSA